jgi:hypothetical protein
MRNPSILLALLALGSAGCFGGYDRELLGDPAPAVSAAPAQATPSEATLAESEYPDSVGEELIHTPSEYGMFDELDPYGAWYQTPEYGTVWQPMAVAGWQPFMYGHWIWTSYGWMWVSYEPFGWATYHYGNWWLDPVMGWIWIPNYNWSPCPADWFYSDGYLGWAPLPPPGRVWDDPWNDQGRYKDPWVVVETGKFKDVDVGENRVPPQRFKAAYRTGTAVRRAPDTNTIERATRQSIKETDVRIDSRRVGEREVRKVVLPTREQQIVDRFPMPGVTPGNTSQTVQPIPTGTGGGSTVAPPANGKSKSPAQPKAKDAAPAKAKSKEGIRGGKDSSGTDKSKGGTKDDKKDSGEKSKGDSKDGGTSKAKGSKR